MKKTASTLILCFGTAMLMVPAARAKDLKAGPLFVLCAAKGSLRVNCEAFTEGFVQGVTSTGVICAPPDAYKEVVADLLTLPQSTIGSGTVAEVLLPRLRAKYPCGVN